MPILIIKTLIVILFVIPMAVLIAVACIQYEKLAAEDAEKRAEDVREQEFTTGGLSRWELERTTAAVMRYDRRRQKRLAQAARYK